MTRRSLPCAALAAVLLLGCSAPPSGDFAATVSGPLEGTIRGNALVCRPPGGEGLTILLHDPENSLSFRLARAAAAIPAPGRYGVVGDSAAPTEGTMHLAPDFGTLEGASEYEYSVRSGSVRIISADSARVEGRFEVELVATDATWEVDPVSREVRRLPTERMPVTGRFSAARAERCAPAAGEEAP